jgi:hypothetical protein
MSDEVTYRYLPSDLALAIDGLSWADMRYVAEMLLEFLPAKPTTEQVAQALSSFADTHRPYDDSEDYE